MKLESARVSFAVYPLAMFFFAIPAVTHGALLYFDPAEADVYRGDTITMSLRLDTEDSECVNVVDTVIHYDPSIRAVDVSRGDSILNVWVEDPVISEEAHTISFAGGIPGGYCGRVPGDPSLTNVVLKVVFRSPGFSIGAGSSPSARIWLDDSSQVFLNDGSGNPAPLRLQDARIQLLSSAANTPNDAWREAILDDKEPPSDFAITLATSSTAFSGRYFIVFNSSDKQSGIDHYEVMEEPFSEWSTFKWGRADAPWIVTESPYVLLDQSLNSTIRVKAIDKAGNTRIATFVPDTALRSISRDRLYTLIVLGAFVIVLGALITYAFMKRRQRIIAEDTEHV